MDPVLFQFSSSSLPGSIPPRIRVGGFYRRLVSPCGTSSKRGFRTDEALGKSIGTWNPTDPCFDRKRQYVGWLVVQNRGHSGSRYMHTAYICILPISCQVIYGESTTKTAQWMDGLLAITTHPVIKRDVLPGELALAQVMAQRSFTA